MERREQSMSFVAVGEPNPISEISERHELLEVWPWISSVMPNLDHRYNVL